MEGIESSYMKLFSYFFHTKWFSFLLAQYCQYCRHWQYSPYGLIGETLVAVWFRLSNFLYILLFCKLLHRLHCSCYNWDSYLSSNYLHLSACAIWDAGQYLTHWWLNLLSSIWLGQWVNFEAGHWTAEEVYELYQYFKLTLNNTPLWQKTVCNNTIVKSNIRFLSRSVIAKIFKGIPDY